MTVCKEENLLDSEEGQIPSSIKRILNATVNTIHDGNVLLLPGGLYNSEIAKLLVAQNSFVTVVTNSIEIFDIVKDEENINTIILGGTYNKNQKYFYVPPKNRHHAVTIHGSSFPAFEDFQTIIVSAIHFAAWAGFNPIVLCSCDNSFLDKRPGCIDIGDGRYIYPHHIRTYALIRGCIFWLKKHNIVVHNASAGLDIKGCPYTRIDKVMDLINRS
jgi:hypothetical protein